MNAKRLVLVLAAATLPLQAACSDLAVGARADGPAPTVKFVKNPVAASDFTVTDLDGRTFSLSSLRGKVVLVNFWATWCGPCRAEIPELIKLQRAYNDHLVILGIATDEPSADQVKAFVKQNGMNYPIVMATDDTRKAFPGVSALPTTYVLDLEGRTVQKHVGLIDVKTYEDETRALAGLVKANIEEFEDHGQLSPLTATDIPGVDLSVLTDAERKSALQKLNSETCTCGCNLTLAQCRINDTACSVSLPLAKEIVAKAKSR
jgi:thiol-disulfide isomerase/thioredoxin